MTNWTQEPALVQDVMTFAYEEKKKNKVRNWEISLQSSCVLFSEFLCIIGSCNCLVWHERKLSNSGGIICCTVRASKLSTTACSIPSALHQLKNGLSTMAIPEGICRAPEVLVFCFSCSSFLWHGSSGQNTKLL
jgi:hypothetical protein